MTSTEQAQKAGNNSTQTQIVNSGNIIACNFGENTELAKMFMDNIATPILAQSANQEQNILEYSKELVGETNNIRPEDFIPPKLSMGKVLAESRWYVDEDYKRKVFARLIASAMNRPTADSLQDTFAAIVPQLGKNDIEVLQILSAHGTNIIRGVVKIKQYDSQENKKNGTYKYVEPIWFSRFSGLVIDGGGDIIVSDEQLRNDTLSLSNLLSLGLFEISSPVFILSDENYYKVYKNATSYKKYKEANGDLIEMDKNSVYITPLGKEFIKLCL